MGGRKTSVSRSTKETLIRAELNIDGVGKAKVSSGFSFLDHCVETLVLHAAFDLELDVESDRPDLHHVAEDVGWTLGELLRTCCSKGDLVAGKPGCIQRFGWAIIPFDEVLVLCSVDLVGRAGCYFQSADQLHNHDIAQFFKGFSMGSAATLHIRMLQEGNLHHGLECAFKALGRVLRQAVAIDSILKEISMKGSVKYEVP
jgi:imidazoleglycerol-phosphate dehydratase